MATSPRSKPTTTDQSTFLWEEPPARASASQDSAAAWATRAATWPSNILGWLTENAPAGWFGRMSPASSPRYLTTLPISVRRTSTWTVITDPLTGKRSWSLTSTTLTKAMRSPASWPDFQNSGMGSPTEFLTLSSPEHASSLEPSLNDGDVCSLSDILETGDHLRPYFLSARACLGILRRAEKRGKELPALLARALRAAAGLGPTST